MTPNFLSFWLLGFSQLLRAPCWSSCTFFVGVLNCFLIEGGCPPPPPTPRFVWLCDPCLVSRTFSKVSLFVPQSVATHQPPLLIGPPWFGFVILVCSRALSAFVAYVIVVILGGWGAKPSPCFLRGPSSGLVILVCNRALSSL